MLWPCQFLDRDFKIGMDPAAELLLAEDSDGGQRSSVRSARIVPSFFTQDREHTTSTIKQIMVITVVPNCMKCNDVLTVGSGHGRGLGQWLQSNPGDEYSVTSVLTLSVELCNIVRKFAVRKEHQIIMGSGCRSAN